MSLYNQEFQGVKPETESLLCVLVLPLQLNNCEDLLMDSTEKSTLSCSDVLIDVMNGCKVDVRKKMKLRRCLRQEPSAERFMAIYFCVTHNLTETKQQTKFGLSLSIALFSQLLLFFSLMCAVSFYLTSNVHILSYCWHLMAPGACVLLIEWIYTQFSAAAR